MDLWIVRHAHAVPERVDPARPLSEEGVRDFTARAALLAREIGMPALVASSPRLRARQTAAILAAAAGYPEGAIVETEALSPAATPAAFSEFLAHHAGRESVVCVGHLPSIAAIASWFLSPGDPIRLAFGAGTACRIRLEAVRRGAGELLLFQ